MGLLIHEGQLTFSELGLVKVLDLGEWWLLETGLPLPLGVNTIRRDLGATRSARCPLCSARRSRPGSTTVRRRSSTRCEFGRGIDAAVADRFVEMYVNELTEDYGDEGRTAVAELLRRGEAIGAFPAPVTIDFVD